MATNKKIKGLVKSQQKLNETAFKNPEDLAVQPDVTKINKQENQFVDPGTGQVEGETGYEASTVDETQTASQPDPQDAVTFESVKTTPQVEEVLDETEAAQGTLSADATVQGQYEKLMSQFEGGEVPPWAAGAIRHANAAMQARGLGASSMAGGAVTQAAMESALPIASQDANIHAQLEMQNLSNRQQMSIFKSQQMIASMFNDQAAENVERQINAASKNQVTQFYAQLHAQVEQFNTAQINAVKQFNAGEENVAKRFNEELNNQRDMFNAQNDLIIAQSNAKWRQDIATLDTRAQNDANLAKAKAANDITQMSLDHLWQRERDLMAFAFQQSENEADRNLKIFLADKEQEFLSSEAQEQREAEDRAGIGRVIGNIVGGIFG